MSDDSLRGQLVEAMTDAFIDSNNNGEEEIEEYAEAALDAALVFLSDNADEWEDAVMDHFGAPVLDAHGFIAVLRDTRETET